MTFSISATPLRRCGLMRLVFAYPFLNAKLVIFPPFFAFLPMSDCNFPHFPEFRSSIWVGEYDMLPQK